jgi:hypothetical protein
MCKFYVDVPTMLSHKTNKEEKEVERTCFIGYIMNGHNVIFPFRDEE